MRNLIGLLLLLMVCQGHAASVNITNIPAAIAAPSTSDTFLGSTSGITRRISISLLETPLEGILDLQDLQGVVTPAQLPGRTNAFAFLTLYTSFTLPATTGGFNQITNYQYSLVSGFTESITGGSLTNQAAGWHSIAFQASLIAGNNDVTHLSIFTNNVQMPGIESERTMGAAAAIGSASGVGVVYLPANCKIDLRLQTSGATDPTLEHVQFTVHALSW